jgi:hypothetical protein
MVELAILAEAAGATVAALPLLGSLAMSAQAIAAGGNAAQLQAWLRADGIDAEVADIEPNLEDVFVSATHRPEKTGSQEARAA